MSSARAPLDGRVRLLHEGGQARPSASDSGGRAGPRVHPLLHHHPGAVVGHHEGVQVERVPVLHRRAVDLGDAAGWHRASAAPSWPVRSPNARQLLRRPPRVLAAAAAHLEAQLPLQRRQPALQRAHHAGGDAGGVPVHPHDRAEGLEPEGCERRRSSSARPYSRTMASAITRPSRAIRWNSQGGTRPPWSGRSALPVGAAPDDRAGAPAGAVRLTARPYPWRALVAS